MMTMTVKDIIRQSAKEHGFLRPGSRVLVGLSGGADSLCLLLNLLELQKEFELEITAVHVHHMIRGEEADADAAFCEKFCGERGIPFILRHVNVRAERSTGESLEEAARNLRYRILFEEAERIGAERIALAHHANDNAETILFHLIRGSGLRGLSGIPQERDRIIRPLLYVGKEEILLDLRARGISYREDSSNDSDDASRNMLRHYAIPVLRSVRHDAVSKISETGQYLSEVDRYLSEEAREALLSQPSADGGISAELLLSAKEVMREYLVSVYLRDRGFSLKDIGRVHLREAALLSSREVGKKLDLPGGLEAIRTYHSIIFRKKDQPVEKESMLPEGTLKIRVFTPEDPMNFPEKECTKWLDYDKIKELPVLRTRKRGDRISIREDARKKLKDWMIDEKIPREERDRVPLAACGPEILWVIGYRIGAAYRVTEQTVRVMELEYVKKEDNEYEG